MGVVQWGVSGIHSFPDFIQLPANTPGKQQMTAQLLMPLPLMLENRMESLVLHFSLGQPQPSPSC